MDPESVTTPLITEIEEETFAVSSGGMASLLAGLWSSRYGLNGLRSITISLGLVAVFASGKYLRWCLQGP
jgi:hypothetical protein